MSEKLTVVLDDISQLEYVRSTPLVSSQRQYLDRLDQKMDAGIELAGLRISQPDTLQRAQFVAMQLLKAVEAGDESVAAASCAYLANRIPDLKQVRAVTRDNALSFDLVFDKAYSKEIKLEFMRPPSVK